MQKGVPFEELLNLFDQYGYKLMGFWRRRPVFDNPRDAEACAWVVPVNDDGTVDPQVFEQIKKFFG